MQHRSTWWIGMGLLWVVAVLGLVVASGRVEADDDKDFEVWAIDQSNSPGTTFGGTLYIYNGRDLIEDARAAVPGSTWGGREVRCAWQRRGQIPCVLILCCSIPATPMPSSPS